MTSSLISTLCQISKVRHLFSKSVLCTILNCLVFTVWSGTFEQNIHKLQLVQNFADRVLTNNRKFDHMLPVLQELGWSSIKHLLLVRDVTRLYKIMNGLAPSYLNSYINKRTWIHSYNTRFGEKSRRSFVQDSHCTTFLSLSIYQHLELAKGKQKK